jgi:hypothetical protein
MNHHILKTITVFHRYVGLNYNFWKASLILLQLFQSIQTTYSRLKYYNTELESNSKDKEFKEKIIKELLEEIRKSIIKSLKKLEDEQI